MNFIHDNNLFVGDLRTWWKKRGYGKRLYVDSKSTNRQSKSFKLNSFIVIKKRYG